VCAEYLKNYYGKDIVPRELILAAGELIIFVGVKYGYSNGTMIWPDWSNPEANWLG
jgi:hypothetical protein